jgi:hypothetical protein
MELSVLSYIGQDSLMLAKGQIRPVLEQVLSDLDKTPDDLRMAAAWRDMDDPSGRVSFDIIAIRSDGVPGEVLHDRLMRTAMGALGRQDLPSYGEWPTLAIGDRVVWTRSEPSDEAWSFFFSKGEVLFMVNVTGRLTMEDVLAKLP